MHGARAFYFELGSESRTATGALYIVFYVLLTHDADCCTCGGYPPAASTRCCARSALILLVASSEVDLRLKRGVFSLPLGFAQDRRDLSLIHI